MSSTIETASQSDRLSPEPDERRIVLGGIGWEQYTQIADAMYGCYVRLTYDRGALELATCSPKDGWIAWLAGRLIDILTEETRTTRRSCGRITIQAPKRALAIASDESFYLTNEPAVRGKDDIDFDVDPPPDLGVEVDISSSSRCRMPVYAALQVPEVWRFSRDRVAIHRLAEDGTFHIAACSRYFTFVTPEVLTEFLARRSALDENTLMAQFREWVRAQVRPE